MTHGFLILTHFPPEKIYHQVSRLQAPNRYFYIHFDKKMAIDNDDAFYKKLLSQENVTILTNRIDVQWGSLKIIDATLALIKEALSNKTIDYLHLFSGECLPVKSAKYIDDYFIKHQGTEFMDRFVMPEKAPNHSITYDRINKYHLHDYFNPRSPKINDVVIKHVNSIFRKLQKIARPAGLYRRYPEGFPTLYAGSQWWSLSYAACSYIIDYVHQHPEFYRRFRHTQATDEFFFQTIMMNGPFKEKVVNESLRFISFNNAISSPNALTMEYLPDIADENKLFGRKFTDASKELLEYLERNVY